MKAYSLGMWLVVAASTGCLKTTTGTIGAADSQTATYTAK